MCGICGASLSAREEVNARALASEMLLGIEDRGRHATGAAWDQGGEVWLAKDAVPASRFVLTDHVIPGARTFIGHTRWATQGSPTNNDNNHPIDVGGLVGIHNGCISNDDDLFEMIGAQKRIAQVDSEAIFATLLHSGLTTAESLQMLTGSAAVAWLDTSAPDVLHLARVSSSPLILARTAKGSLLFASTLSCLRKAAEKAGLEIESVTTVEEGTYLAVRAGEIVAREEFDTVARSLTATERTALGAW